MSETKEQYQNAVEDMSTLVESTNELIDMHFTQYAEFLEDKNIGVLKAYRTLFQRQLDQADVIGKQLTESNLTTFATNDRIKLGSVYSAVAKIVDRIGYIDYLIEKRKLTV